MQPEKSSNCAYVLSISAAATEGWIRCGNLLLRCAIGRSGVRSVKREGDGATPLGVWRLRRAFYRRDRIARPATLLPLKEIRLRDGWCDEPTDRNYNRPVPLPYPASAETMYRDDHVYDLVVELGYNDCPRSRGRGSAVFMHLAREGYKPTAGCVALSERDMRMLLSRLHRRATISIGAKTGPVKAAC